MGHDVRIIGKHNLDTSSLEALAITLSKSLEVSIKYGYNDKFDYNPDGKYRKASWELVQLGEIIYPDACTTIWLTDEYFPIHQLIKKQGNNIYDLPCFKLDYIQREIIEAMNNICFELRDWENDYNWGVIFNNTFHNDFNYFYPRWWSFCNAFMEDQTGSWDHIYNTAMYKHRKDVFQFFSCMDVSEAVYLDDQGETAGLAVDFYDWETIVSELNTKFKDTTLHVSDFMKQRKLLPKGKYPLAFYDDFADLKG
ncbi:hypothetical protein [Gaoshiqia sediminis]|uniref:Uncharacterized protein n=1 Tax=Gaoshiqia sediminis TaxID=2986998 RepID=A0AA42C5X3_9BACT|nr:hypothetical protein [Gaoshiqia sediminis]MCW0483318.1 hypothetical protein [Gaoshiqia sediminis]